MSSAILIALLVAADPPVLEVTADDTVVTESCRISIPEGLVIRDANGDGVIHVGADSVTLDFNSSPGALRARRPARRSIAWTVSGSGSTIITA